MAAIQEKIGPLQVKQERVSMAAYAYNLLLIHTPTAQDISDWREVARLIRDQAPDIEVRIAPNFSRNPITR
jgi:hypothetical protein